MAYLCDTNSLLRLSQKAHPLSAVAQNATQTLLRRSERVCIFPQCLTEFWADTLRQEKP